MLMRNSLIYLFCFLSFFVKAQSTYQYSVAQDSAYIRNNYVKSEFMVKMRDGVQLFTQVYAPKDKSKLHPIIMQRTPYSCNPYGTDIYNKRIGPNPFMIRENYIVVYQDVRGRWASEGKFIEMTPHLDKKSSEKDIDESTDTYDTIEWLTKNIPNNNGKVGQWGISYPGFFTSAGSVSQHPALKASSPQAPMADLWRDDAFHLGAFMLGANFGFYNFFQAQTQPIKNRPAPYFSFDSPDGYDFYLKMGPTRNAEDQYYKKRNEYFHENFDHPNFDEHWQKRNILPHLQNIKHAVLVVGGWYDEQDLYGTFKTYQAMEKQSPNNDIRFVVGPWVHGGWAGASGQSLADVEFGSKTSLYYQEKIESPFFNHYLIDESLPLSLAEATLFETGSNQWRSFDTYPAKNAQETVLYLQNGGKLGFTKPQNENGVTSYISDPSRPVPFSGKINDGFSAEYMVEDQRFAYQRPDVISFETDTLKDDLTMVGNILANLKVSTSGTDADWVVKVIDVYPNDTPNDPAHPDVVYGGYQQLIRSEIIRGKYRNDFTKPEAFVPGKPTEVKLELQDVLHTFKKGHKIMVQIQSSCFPWADRNPQKFVNIFEAKESDYQKATQKVYHQKAYPSFITFGVLKN